MADNKVQLPRIDDSKESVQRAFDAVKNHLNKQSNNTYTGFGSPEGVLAASVGSIYTDQKGTTNTTLYIKETGGESSSGWVVKGSGGTTTPALTGKYVLPSTYPLTGTPTKFMYQTIPASGLFDIDGFFNYLSTSGASYAHFYLAKNGTFITGLGIEPYAAATGSQFPISFAFKETFNAGDEVAVYGYVDTGYAGSVYIQGTTRQAFIQYTQLQSNVPVVASLGQDAWVGPLQDLTIASRDKAAANSWAKVKFTKDSGGQWFAEIWLSDQWASATLTGQNWYTTGISAKDDTSGAGLYWPLAGGVPNYVGPMYYCLMYPNNLAAGRIGLYHASGATTGVFAQGKVPLNSKPVGYGIPASV